MADLKAGVIGLGIGRQHVRVLSEMRGVHLVAVADLDAELAGEVAEENGVRSCKSGAELIEGEELDIVCICTPPAAHLELTRRAADRGGHVCCEKPMAPTLADCDGMIDACERSDVRLMIAQKKRWQPIYRLVRDFSRGEFGPLRWATMSFACGRVGHEWFWSEEDGGGPLQENTVHAVDILRFLIGEIKRVYAEGANLFNQDRAPQLDTAVVTLRFADGAIASLGTGQASEWGFAGESCSMGFENAAARVWGEFDNPGHLRYVLRDDRGSVVSVDRVGADLFRLELDHFVECVREGTEPIASGRDVRGSVEVCRAIKESARRKRPVEID